MAEEAEIVEAQVEEDLGGGSAPEAVEERRGRKRGTGFIRRYWPILLVLLLIIAAFAGGFYIGRNGISGPNSGGGDGLNLVDSHAVITQIEEVSKLTTVEMLYQDIDEFKTDGKIPFINSTSFTMFYSVTISAGVDLSDVTPEIDDEARTITVIIPEAEIQSIETHEDDFAYFDEKSSLLDPIDLENSDEAKKLAKEDAREKVTELGLLDDATENAKSQIEGFLSPFTEDVYADKDGNCYEVIVEVEGEDADEAEEADEEE